MSNNNPFAFVNTIMSSKESGKETTLMEADKEMQDMQDMHVEEVTCMDLPLDWSNYFDSDERTKGIHIESISDALVHCLTTLGEVDIEYISSVTGADYKTVICTLKGAIYQNPDTWGECFFKGWETSEEYLSGNLMRKWQVARDANQEYKGYFEDNLKAIEKLLPPTVATKDIYITLGSPWVPADIIDDFIEHLFGDPLQFYVFYIDREKMMEYFRTIHDELTGTWEIPQKRRYNHSVAVKKTYGTSRMEALHILEKTLNMKTVVVRDEIKDPNDSTKTKRVINKAETVAVLEKQQKLIEEFKNWVWTDKARKERLETIFENNFSCIKRRIFDGSFLDFPTMSKDIELYPYQKNAVARIIFTPNTLLAHDVGAGKTYVMIAAGQELRRMGLSNKNMYVVPNNLVGQWKNIFLSMYPSANLLCVEPKTFTKAKREEVLIRMRDEEFDGIIIAYSCFEMIPLSKEFYMQELREKSAQINKVIIRKSKVTSKLKKKKEELEKKLSELAVTMEKAENMIYFDELGINRLFVDEAHNFKNVPL